MGEDRPYTELELRRIARQQRSPEFQSWLAREPEDLARLITLVPALAELDDPWTVPGLTAIEDAAMDRFPDPGPSATDEEMQYMALCARGIGHTYLRALGVGKWVWVQIYRENPIGPALEVPGDMFYTDPGESIRDIIFDRRRGWLAEQLRHLIDLSRQQSQIG
ncbi:hypothetical protein ACFO5K_10560 [Nocardia halotolerans]|uniref:DUF3806 domain-containing protein n=1 Tax=Nocardia halotolerans TaxID=1755878 RepID=A0ABV8VGT1_9NOCA